MANGFFAGGLAKSLSQQSFPRTQIAMQRREAEAERAEQLRERSVDVVNRLDESLTKIIEMRDTAISNGQEPPPELHRLFNRLNKQRERTAQLAGLPAATLPSLEQIPPEDLTPEQQREQDVKTERATAQASVQGRTAGEIGAARSAVNAAEADPSIRPGLEAQGLMPDESTKIQNYAVTRDGKTSIQPMDENDPEDAAQIRAMREDPNVQIQRISTTVQSTDVAGAVTGTPVSQGDREEAVAQIPEIRQNMVKAGQLSQRVEEVGQGASFIPRKIVTVVGGFIGNFSPAVEQAIGSFVGISPEDARQLEVEMRRTAANLIAPITGEESGRKTETEREIANRVSAMDVVNASITQIRAALPAIYTLWLQELSRSEIEAGNRMTFDVVDDQGNQNKEGMLQLIDEMESFGFPENTQRRVLSNFIVLQRELKQLDLGRGDQGGMGPAS